MLDLPIPTVPLPTGKGGAYCGVASWGRLTQRMPFAELKKRNAMKTIQRDKLVKFLDSELRIKKTEDLCRNGLEVEAAETISRVGLAVDACRAAYEAAAEERCQMLIVHHGMIWGGVPSITGETGRQIKFLLDHGINLYAAHLPLDLHEKYGNNARLAEIMGLKKWKRFGDYKGTIIGFEGMLPAAETIESVSRRLQNALGGPNVVLPFGKKNFRRVAVVSGRATDMLAQAIDAGAECFVTGEPKHEHYHLAKEAGINAIYCGHYYSEKVGVQAVGKLLEKKFGIECAFLDVPTVM